MSLCNEKAKSLCWKLSGGFVGIEDNTLTDNHCTCTHLVAVHLAKVTVDRFYPRCGKVQAF